MRRMMRNRLRNASRDGNAGNNAMNDVELGVPNISADLQPRDTCIKYLQNDMQVCCLSWDMRYGSIDWLYRCCRGVEE